MQRGRVFIQRSIFLSICGWVGGFQRSINQNENPHPLKGGSGRSCDAWMEAWATKVFSPAMPGGSLAPSDFFKSLARMALIPFLFSKNRKIYARFPVLNSYCERSNFGGFLGPSENVRFLASMALFSFFLNNKTINAGFPLLNSYCKNSYF